MLVILLLSKWTIFVILQLFFAAETNNPNFPKPRKY